MRKLFIILCTFLFSSLQSQELYVFSEPASNMPANTFSPKFKANLSNRPDSSFQRYTPEIMFGISKEFMFHMATSFSNMHSSDLKWESVFAYAKYRFYSKDEVHQHFRMAAFAEGGYSDNPLYYDEISVRGDNSGFELGWIGTQLINKTAVSLTTSFVKVYGNKPEHAHHELVRSAINYSLSAGQLILPVEYTSYDQLNFNLYLEILGQHALDKNASFLDFAPAMQFIFNSNSKLNLGYRFQVNGNALRGVENSFLISFEHTFFNALKKRKSKKA